MLDAFTAVTFVAGAITLVLAFLNFGSRRPSSNWLGSACLAGSSVIFFYLGSIYASSIQQMSMLTSISFASIDGVLVSLLVYFLKTKGATRKEPSSQYVTAVFVLAGLDCLLLLSNPATNMVLSYEFAPLAGEEHWAMVPHPLYYAHLVFDYLLVVGCIGVLSYRATQIPKVYHVRYIPMIVIILIIVALNVLFLAFPAGHVDYSIPLYAFCAGFICVNDFYLEKRMLRIRVKERVLRSLDQPTLFFDKDQILRFGNEGALNLFGFLTEDGRSTLRAFVQQLGLQGELDPGNLPAAAAFRCTVMRKDQPAYFRVDYKRLTDHKDRLVGYLVSFLDVSFEIDAITGFRSKAVFYRELKQIESRAKETSCVILFDINRLATLNLEKGRSAGDEAIRRLSVCMKEHLPAQTEFARLDDAVLLACCPDLRQHTARECCSRIAWDLQQDDSVVGPLDVQSTVCMASETALNMQACVQRALRSLRVRKMLDRGSLHSSLLNSLEQIMHESDPGTEAHVQRTKDAAMQLGNRLGLSDYDQSSLALLCLVHDVGKLGIPVEILNKPGVLAHEEWDLMKSHVEKGYRIAMASDDLRELAPCIRHHHERWDGEGYPDGLKHEAIPLLSRIVAVVDTFDAMVNDRPYRTSLTYAAAREELLRCSGTQFDPFVVQTYLELLEDQGAFDQQVAPAVGRPEQVLPLGLTTLNRLENAQRGLAELQCTHYVLDARDRIVEVGEGFAELTGYTAEDIATLRPRQIDFIFPEDREFYTELVLSQFAHADEAFVEHRLMRKDGSERNVLCYGRKYFDPVVREPRVNVMVIDVAHSSMMKMLLERERQSARRSLDYWEQGARMDSLTGALNRRSFVEAVRSMLVEEGSRVLMAIIDVDAFKGFNDTYGHPSGDALLVDIVSKMKKKLPVEAAVGRLGGDEFAVAVSLEGNVQEQEALKYAQALWNKLRVYLAGRERPASISVGVYLSGADDFRFDDMYAMADAALYEAKEGGRNRICMKVKRA